jgi:hypothetical protein
MSPNKPKTTERFFLDQSESSDWYLIPVAKRKEWEKCRDECRDDEELPEGVRYINSASDITFENPK